MLIDGRVEHPSPPAYDVLIVGAGPAGIILAVELADAGLRIGLVESGGRDFDPDTQMLYDGSVTGNEDDLDLTAIRLRMLGGTSNHWGGHCLPLDPVDFERAPPGLSGWPIGREELEPYYARAVSYFELGEQTYTSDALRDVSVDDLYLNDVATWETRLKRQAVDKAFGEVFWDRLVASETIDLWLWANLTDLPLSGEGQHGPVTVQSLTGRTHTLDGRILVLACGAVENARQLMVANARSGTRLGDAGELLGKCYMDHPRGGAGFLSFSRPQPDKPYWDRGARTIDDIPVPVQVVLRPTDAVFAETGLPNTQFYLVPFAADPEVRERQRAANRSVGELRSIAKYALGRDVGPDFRLSEAYCEFITNADSFVLQTALELTGQTGVTRALILHESEQFPDRANAVTLSDDLDALGQPRAAVHWGISTDQVAAIQGLTERLGQAAGAAGLGRVELEDHGDDPYWGMSTSYHQIGTTRMAASETSGVTDPTCRVFGSRALYMAGAGVFPTAGRANPTFTIGALSIRLADHLVQEVRNL